MPNQLDIANRALLGVGARAQISSLNPSDGSDEANAISILWSPTFEQLGRAAPWNCLRKQVSLTLLMAAQGTPENPDGTTYDQPPTPWLYAYGYPADCLLFRFIVPSLPAQSVSSTPQTTISNNSATWIPTGGQIPYAISSIGDTNNSPIMIILTNQDQAQGVYNANIQNPQIWDSMFQAAMVASLGAFLVPALSLSMPLMNMAIKLADELIAKARAQDGNEGVTSMDHTPDWFQARAGGSGWGWGYANAGSFSGWISPAWPWGNGTSYA